LQRKTKAKSKHVVRQQTTLGVNAQIRLKQAHGIFNSLVRQGLLGSPVPVGAATVYVNARIWSVLDSGRPITQAQIAQSDELRLKFSVLQHKIACQVLGVSTSVPTAAVLSELAWPSDMARADSLLLGFVHWMASAPELPAPASL
jgi:hypothetical protein